MGGKQHQRQHSQRTQASPESALVERYRTCTPFEKRLIELLSLRFRGLEPNKLRELVYELDPSRAQLHIVTKTLDTLAARGLLIALASRVYRCADTLADDVLADLVETGRLAEIGEVAIERPLRRSHHYYYGGIDKDFQLEDLRFALFAGDESRLQAARRRPLGRSFEPVLHHPYSTIFDRPLRTRLLSLLEQSRRALVYLAITEDRCAYLDPFRPVVEETDVSAWPRLVDLIALTSGCTELLATAEEDRLPETVAGEAFLRGEKLAALKGWHDALSLRRRQRQDRTHFDERVTGLWLLIARLELGGQVNLKRARSDARHTAAMFMGSRGWSAWAAFEAAAEARLGEPDVAKLKLDACLTDVQVQWRSLGPQHVNAHWAYFALAASMVDVAVVKAIEPALVAVCERAYDNDYPLVALIAAEVLADVLGRDKFRRMADTIRTSTGLPSFIQKAHLEAPWEKALHALATVPEKAALATQDKRLVWLVDDTHGIEFEAREQKRQKNGAWTKGRKVGVQRLAEGDPSFDYFTRQDHLMAGCFRLLTSWGQSYVEQDFAALADAAVGHPHVYRADDPSRAVEIVRVEPELRVREHDEGFALELSKVVDDAATTVSWESDTRLVVTRAGEAHKRIAAIVGTGLVVPASGREKLQTVLGALGAMITVASDLEIASAIADELPCDGRLRARFRREGRRYHLVLRVAPLGEHGPVFPPGGGPEVVLATVDGAPRRTERALARERSVAYELAASCRVLYEHLNDSFAWHLEDDGACLEALSTFHSATDDALIEWDGEQALRPPTPVESASFKVSVKAKGDWFEIGGDVKVDDEVVLSLSQLMRLLATSQSRFVSLDSGQVLALTDALRERVAALDNLAESNGKELRVRRSAALAVEHVLGEMGVQPTGRTFKTVVDKMRGNGPVAPVPSTLAGELRAYQVEGYGWMMRLAEAGFGACLADDMGLGKTIQALAMLLARAPGGPALVIAPTSVGPNWVQEARRFAPTLQVELLRQGARADQVAALGPFDVLVISYGLLHTERDLLATVTWNTLVLDEAQAIKNDTTKRFKAAVALDAGFRLITTGTPVENHLGELWALMHFLNPGLLGTRKRFDARFAGPIERDSDPASRRLLRALVRPFVLRRKKADVLEDLPARMEATLRVEFSADERVFYEALRRQAVEAINEGEPGERRFRILAELTRLRRACCAPKLIRPELAIESSKLAALDELVSELLQGGHKALVFSQFVSFLTLVRARLDAAGVSYQYLDGSTPQKTRAERVAAFQAGDGDLFLISLKAGGTGLNLTAADYVVHLDPWWNPAVEDQASDRAHRIGQARPVTIYRFVAADTIEERIVDLHHHKRELAEGLLAGTETASRLDIDELWALLKEAT